MYTERKVNMKQYLGSIVNFRFMLELFTNYFRQFTNIYNLFLTGVTSYSESVTYLRLRHHQTVTKFSASDDNQTLHTGYLVVHIGQYFHKSDTRTMTYPNINLKNRISQVSEFAYSGMHTRSSTVRPRTLFTLAYLHLVASYRTSYFGLRTGKVTGGWRTLILRRNLYVLCYSLEATFLPNSA
jgi:hypothetical protein